VTASRDTVEVLRLQWVKPRQKAGQIAFYLLTTHPHPPLHTHTRHTHTRARVRTHTRTHTPSHTHTHTHAHTHTHTHTKDCRKYLHTPKIVPRYAFIEVHMHPNHAYNDREHVQYEWQRKRIIKTLYSHSSWQKRWLRKGEDITLHATTISLVETEFHEIP
jgi:hypothetical protein